MSAAPVRSAPAAAMSLSCRPVAVKSKPKLDRARFAWKTSKAVCVPRRVAVTSRLTASPRGTWEVRTGSGGISACSAKCGVRSLCPRQFQFDQSRRPGNCRRHAEQARSPWQSTRRRRLQSRPAQRLRRYRRQIEPLSAVGCRLSANCHHERTSVREGSAFKGGAGALARVLPQLPITNYLLPIPSFALSAPHPSQSTRVCSSFTRLADC